MNALLIKKITKVDTTCEITNKFYKKCLPELSKLFQLYNSVWLSSAATECAFSTMHQKQSWLRANMKVLISIYNVLTLSTQRQLPMSDSYFS